MNTPFSTLGNNEVEIQYINDSYQFKIMNDWVFENNGRQTHYKVAELTSSVDKDPTFIFRWDDNDSQKCIDVDISYKNLPKTDTEEIRKLWNQQSFGYKGHHSIIVEPWLFEILIEIPNRRIFHAYVNLKGLSRQVSHSIDTYVAESRTDSI